MANNKSAAKRARQADVRRQTNRSAKSEILTVRRQFLQAVESKDKGKALEQFKAFCSILDKSAKRGIIMTNNADRRKERASAMLAKMA
jgi:small subunit ribosomal protein S20